MLLIFIIIYLFKKKRKGHKSLSLQVINNSQKFAISTYFTKIMSNFCIIVLEFMTKKKET